MIVATTGHRPDKVGGYSDEARKKLELFAKGQMTILRDQLIVDKVLTGMALGWDQAVATACIELSIPWVACIPFKGQHLKWPLESQARYRELMKHTNEIKIVCEGGYEPYKMILRDEYMVDECQLLVALHNGTKGGTGTTVRYARMMGRDIINWWRQWTEF